MSRSLGGFTPRKIDFSFDGLDINKVEVINIDSRLPDSVNANTSPSKSFDWADVDDEKVSNDLETAYNDGEVLQVTLDDGTTVKKYKTDTGDVVEEGNTKYTTDSDGDVSVEIGDTSLNFKKSEVDDIIGDADTETKAINKTQEKLSKSAHKNKNITPERIKRAMDEIKTRAENGDIDLKKEGGRLKRIMKIAKIAGPILASLIIALYALITGKSIGDAIGDVTSKGIEAILAAVMEALKEVAAPAAKGIWDVFKGFLSEFKTPLIITGIVLVSLFALYILMMIMMS